MKKRIFELNSDTNWLAPRETGAPISLSENTFDTICLDVLKVP